MSTKKTTYTIDQLCRITSSTGVLYLTLKDGKRHSVETLKTMFAERGHRSIWGLAFKLRRLLYNYMGQTIQIENRHNKNATVQIVPLAKTAKTATKATKPAKAEKKTATKPRAAKKAAPAAAEEEVVTA